MSLRTGKRGRERSGRVGFQERDPKKFKRSEMGGPMASVPWRGEKVDRIYDPAILR